MYQTDKSNLGTRNTTHKVNNRRVMYNTTTKLKAISPDPRCCELPWLPQHRTVNSSQTSMILMASRFYQQCQHLVRRWFDSYLLFADSTRVAPNHQLEFDHEFCPKFRSIFDATKTLTFKASIDRFRSVSSPNLLVPWQRYPYEYTASLLKRITPMCIVRLSDKNFLDSWENRDQIGGQRSRDVFSNSF